MAQEDKPLGDTQGVDEGRVLRQTQASFADGGKPKPFTPGPWMVAAGPSSIVGWPVVAAGGRSICSLSWLGKKPDDVSDEAFAAYRAEVEANGRLIAAAPKLLAALRRIEWGGLGDTGRYLSAEECRKVARAAIAEVEARP